MIDPKDARRVTMAIRVEMVRRSITYKQLRELLREKQGYEIPVGTLQNRVTSGKLRASLFLRIMDAMGAVRVELPPRSGS